MMLSICLSPETLTQKRYFLKNWIIQSYGLCWSWQLRTGGGRRRFNAQRKTELTAQFSPVFRRA